MYPLGYLILMVNLQNLSIKNGVLKHSEVRIASLETLKIELETSPDFPIEGYKEDGLQRNDDISVYISKNLREYLFKGKGKPDDEGVIIRLYFLRYLPRPGQNAGPKESFAYFIHRDGIEDDVKEKVNDYILKATDVRRKRSAG